MRHLRSGAAGTGDLVIEVRDLGDLPGCQRCELSLTRQRVVVGSGRCRGGLMVVGEAPGRSEDEGGEPFIGRSGRLLTTLIEEELELSRSDYFITNVVKCRPPANRTPTRHEVATCRAWLEVQRDQHSPHAVLCVGATAARAVLGQVESMAKIHGRWAWWGPVRGITTYHPAAALRAGPNLVAVMRQDLRELRRHLGT